MHNNQPAPSGSGDQNHDPPRQGGRKPCASTHPTATLKSVEAYTIMTQAAEEGASDVILSAGQPLALRVNGNINVIGTALTTEQVQRFIDELRTSEQRADPKNDFSRDVARFPARMRINISNDHRGPVVTVRLIRRDLPAPAELGVPQAIITRVQQCAPGLILISGPTDSGKSTTIASCIAHALKTRPLHVLTIEDPVEYLIPPGQGVINQREVERADFPHAVTNSLRQVPDIIMIGELRGRESLQAALEAAESGHLVIASVHARNAIDAVQRIATSFPDARQSSVLQQLSSVLIASLHQRLLPDRQGGRTMINELLLNLPHVRGNVASGAFHQIPNQMSTGSKYGLHTLQHDLEQKAGQLQAEYVKLLNAEFAPTPTP